MQKEQFSEWGGVGWRQVYRTALCWPHIYSDIGLLQNAPFRSQIFKIFFASGGKGALTNQNPADALGETYSVGLFYVHIFNVFWKKFRPTRVWILNNTVQFVRPKGTSALGHKWTLRHYHFQLCTTLKRFQTLTLGPTTDRIVKTTIYTTTRKFAVVTSVNDILLQLHKLQKTLWRGNIVRVATVSSDHRNMHSAGSHSWATACRLVHWAIRG